MRRFVPVLVLVLGLAVGCSQRVPPPAVTGEKLITLEQWSQMTEGERADPYVLQNLDPEAKKALASKKTRLP